MNTSSFKSFWILLFLLHSSFINSQTTQIGNQIWMTNNLDKIELNNGVFLIEAQNIGQWLNAIKNKQPAYCYYNFNRKNGDKYGLIYNWYAVIDSAGISPIGFHIPSKSEWSELVEFISAKNMQSVKSLKSRFDWKMGHNGTNHFNFNAKPVGFLGGGNNFFVDDDKTIWWTYDGFYDSKSQNLSLIDEQPWAVKLEENFYFYSTNISAGFSIRCIKD